MSHAHQIVDQLLESSAKDTIFDLANNGPWQRDLARDGFEVENSNSEYWVATKNVQFKNGPTVMIGLTAPQRKETGSMMCEIGVWEWLNYKGGTPGSSVFFRRIHTDNAMFVIKILANRIRRYPYDLGVSLKKNVEAASKFTNNF